MPVQDFLVTFRADTTQALSAINALYARVTQVDTKLNSAMGRQSTIGSTQFNQMTAGANKAAAATGKLYNRIEDFNQVMTKTKNKAGATVFVPADKALNRLIGNYVKLNNTIRNTQAAGEIVPASQISRAITSLELLRGKAGVTNDTINALQQGFRDMRSAQVFGKNIDQLTTRFNRLDRVMGRAGGMTPANIRAQRDTIQELQRLNTLAGGGAIDPRVNRMAPIIEAQFRRLPTAIDAARNSMQAFNNTVERQISLANTYKTPLPSPTRVANAFQNTLTTLRTPNLDPQVYAEAARQGEIYANTLRKFPAGLNEATRAFGTHAKRIAEGILLYDLMGRALQAVSGQIKLVSDLAREQIRFEAVVGGNVNDVEFLEGISRVAVATNTPLADLAGIMDTVAGATDNAGSAAQREADALQLMNLAGMQTNVTQRGLAVETENLLGIMNVFRLGVDGVGDALGRITVMGGNSSTAIAAITDVISAAGRSAAAAQFDFDLLGSLGAEMFRALRGSMSGGEIGNMLNTIFGKIADPKIQQNITEMTGGLIQFRDELGNLRSGSDVFLELFAAIEAGAFSSEQAARILDQIIPPLNPAAQSFVTTLQRVLPDALALSERAGQATEEQLKELSDLLVSGPGEQFSRAIIALQTAFTELLSSGILGWMEAFAGIIQGLADLLSNDFTGSIAGVVIQLGIFFTAFKALAYIGKGLGVFFIGRRALDELAVAIRGAGTASTVAGGQMTMGLGGPLVNTKGQVDRLGGAFKTLRGALAAPITILIAMEVLSDIPRIVNGIKAQLDEELSSGLVDKGTLDRAFRELTNPDVLGVDLVGLMRGDFLFGNAAAGASNLTDIQWKNVLNLAEAMVKLKDEGKLTAASQKVLDEAITGVGGAISSELVTVDELISAYNESKTESFNAAQGTSAWEEELRKATEAANANAEAVERQASALEISASLSAARATELARLNAALAAGSITLEEFTDGQSNLGSASEAAAAWVAAYGDQLNLLPGLQERVATTGESAAEALLGMLLQNPETLDARIDIINSMVEIAEANQELADELAENPIVFSVETQKLIDDVSDVQTIMQPVMNGWLVVERQIAANPIEPQIALDRLRAQAVAALKIMRSILAAQSAFSNPAFKSLPGFSMLGKVSGIAANQQKGTLDALNSAIAELEAAAGKLGNAGGELGALGDAWNTAGGIRTGDPRLAGTSGSGPSQTGIIDIGDLSAAAISQIVAIAQAAQARVVAAGGTVDTDETVAFFKDAVFQRLISGVDQRFLQQAIEELTEVERRRLELEQQRLQDVTRSMVVQTGPIQSIVSAPVLAAGGGVLSGQGLNADPRLGNFTINVPINWSGMSLQQLQEFIYKSIAQAWLDASRGG